MKIKDLFKIGLVGVFLSSSTFCLNADEGDAWALDPDQDGVYEIRVNSTGSLVTTEAGTLSGNQTVGGTLGVTGATTLTGALTANGDAQFNSTTTAAGGLDVTGGADIDDLVVTGTLIYSIQETQTLTGDAETITVSAPVVTVDAGGTARTGTILAAGGDDGQVIYLTNIGGETITFNTTPATSNINGTDQAGSDAIAAGATVAFAWIESSSLWFEVTNLS